jgi:hypothetical protein
MAKKKAPTNDQDGVSNSANGHWQEVECKIIQTEKGPVAEKLKVIRETVKITDEEAATLNAGRLTGGNLYVKMYFKNSFPC